VADADKLVSWLAEHVTHEERRPVLDDPHSRAVVVALLVERKGGSWSNGTRRRDTDAPGQGCSRP